MSAPEVQPRPTPPAPRATPTPAPAGGLADPLIGPPAPRTGGSGPQHTAPGPQAAEPVIQDRAWFLDQQAQGNFPAQMAPEEFFHEFVAHNLAYKELDGGEDGSLAYTDYDRSMIEAWGFDPNSVEEVHNADSGLHAVRLNPMLDENGAQVDPLARTTVGMRGTDPELNDIIADADTNIGQDQLEGERAAIANLMRNDDGRGVDVTGHSLGGALAQRAAAWHVGDVNRVTTFQSPGIERSAVDQFVAGNQDGHATVQHHYVASDTVHRAGAERLPGQFHEHHIEGTTELPVAALKDINISHRGWQYYNPEMDPTVPQDSLRLADHNVSTVHSNQDTVGDRHWHEGMRQGLGSVTSAVEGVVEGGSVALEGREQAVAERNIAIAQTAIENGQHLAHAGGEAVEGGRDVLSGANTAASGLYEAATGDHTWRESAAIAGTSLFSGGMQAWDGLGDLGSAAQETRGALWDAGVDITAAGGRSAWDTGVSLGQGLGVFGHHMQDAGQQAAMSVYEHHQQRQQNRANLFRAGAAGAGRLWNWATGGDDG